MSQTPQSPTLDVEEVLTEHGEALDSSRRTESALKGRIAGLEADLRAAEQAGAEREDRAARDAAFHEALRTFDAQPRMRSDYSVAENKQLLLNWMRRHGYTTPTQQIAYIETQLSSRGYAIAGA